MPPPARIAANRTPQRPTGLPASPKRSCIRRHRWSAARSGPELQRIRGGPNARSSNGVGSKHAHVTVRDRSYRPDRSQGWCCCAWSAHRAFVNCFLRWRTFPHGWGHLTVPALTVTDCRRVIPPCVRQFRLATTGEGEARLQRQSGQCVGLLPAAARLLTD